MEAATKPGGGSSSSAGSGAASGSSSGSASSSGSGTVGRFPPDPAVVQKKPRAPQPQAPQPEGSTGRFNFDKPMKAGEAQPRVGNAKEAAAQVRAAAGPAPRAKPAAETPVVAPVKGPAGRFNFAEPTKALGEVAAKATVSANAAESFAQTAQRAGLKRHTRPGAGVAQGAAKGAGKGAAPAPKPAGREPVLVGGGGGSGGGGAPPELTKVIDTIKSKVSGLSQAQIFGGAVALWTAGLANMYAMCLLPAPCSSLLAPRSLLSIGQPDRKLLRVVFSGTGGSRRQVVSPTWTSTGTGVTSQRSAL
jgi:hypothetical protein